MDYKNTINLPKTEFPMKANLSQREPGILAEWEKADLYGALRAKGKGRPLFILHDGPPYANGHIHIGHALNKVLKDVVVRYKSMRGFDAPYIPGWDCHGLPVEHQLFKELKITKEQIDRVSFRAKAHAYAMGFVEIQREEFKRLGILGDWERPYLTLAPSYEHAILESFATLVEKGFIYRGLKPVNWCPKCETALAEAEVEYADHESDSIFARFRVKREGRTKESGLPPDRDVFVLIWTTTPWTLIANVAVAVHPRLDYAIIEAGPQVLIVAAALKASVEEKLGLKGTKVLATVKGKSLEGLLYEHPFGLREGRVVLADYVSHEDGTGCVHIAPGHGQEDFAVGLEYELPVVMPVDTRGRFVSDVESFAGQHVFAANEAIIARLASSGSLAWSARLTHQYPHCWRCKSPVIFRATHQWFLRIDHRGLRADLLAAIRRDVQWVPASGQERISAMVENRPDWCLSRQRYWGVPIPAVVCKSCGAHILDAAVARRFAAVALEEGTDSWFKKGVGAFLPQGFACSCGSRDLEGSADILDVWFDSGVSHQAVLKGKPGLRVPADLYLEGSDQHRGWFQTSLIPSMAIDGAPPFKSVLTHGFVVDGEGRKMSKSLGNVVAPQEVIRDAGADVLRLWVFSSDYNEDVRISRDILAFVTDAYRKIRNTIRFLLGNLSDFDPVADRLGRDRWLEIDRWAMFRLGRLIDEVTQAYDEYKFYRAFQALYAFCNEEMSSLYLDILKDRLYTAAKASPARRSAQTVLYEILDALVRLLAPVIPFTAEEVYRLMPSRQAAAKESIHLGAWPDLPAAVRVEEGDVRDMARVLELRDPVLKAIEHSREQGGLGSSLEAKVVLTVKDERTAEVCRRLGEQLPFIFIVSQVEVACDGSQGEEVRVEVGRAEGQKCVRCWNYSPSVGEVPGLEGLCGRCASAVGGHKP